MQSPPESPQLSRLWRTVKPRATAGLLLAAAVAAGLWLGPRFLLGPRVEATAVARRDFVQSVVASGHVETPHRVNIGTQVTGTVKRVPVAEGQAVRAGLGPHSGLKLQEARFKAALDALGDPARTTVVLVTRPDKGAMAEAARTSEELRALGLGNQRLAINGVFHASVSTDAVACAIEALGRQALAEMPQSLCALPQDRVPLRAFDTVGLPALRALLGAAAPVAPEATALPEFAPPLQGLDALADELAAAGRGLIMVMGKGGVGKTTVAAALALGLVQRGKTVHLSTTDPAAHLAETLEGEVPGLRVDRIDPKLETQRYVEKIMAARSPGLDAQEQALLREDLRSPCTEEVAVFHAFSRIVSEARTAFVVLDTAYTRIILVTLPEVTPVSQAAALQEDLRRAGIEPYAWVLNKSVLAAGTHEPLLAARLSGERRQMKRMSAGLAKRIFTLAWLVRPPIGFAELSRLVAKKAAAAGANA